MLQMKKDGLIGDISMAGVNGKKVCGPKLAYKMNAKHDLVLSSQSNDWHS